MNAEGFTQGSAALNMPESAVFCLEAVDGMIAPPCAPAVTARSGTRIRSLLRAACCTMCLAVLLGAFLCAGLRVICAERTGYEQSLAAAPRMRALVETGDSLWSIARAHPITGLRVSQVSDIIRAWNGLDTATLTPGETLIVPDVEA